VNFIIPFTWYNQGNSKCFHSVANKGDEAGQRVRGPTWVVDIVKNTGRKSDILLRGLGAWPGKM